MKKKIYYKCIACGKLSHIIIWNDKIRSGSKVFTQKRHKIIKCLNCNLIRLLKINKNSENNILQRNLYNKSYKINDFLKFHKIREKKKLDCISKYLNFNNSTVLKSNCGAGIILDLIKKKTKMTAGFDAFFYKNFLESNGHKYFSSIKIIKKEKIKFDFIFSMSELEHKLRPVEFLLNIKSILKKNGKLILRIPNYYNIYRFLMGKKFDATDYRESHNFYFSEKNLNFIFKKINFNIDKIIGFNEYSFNHLLNYIQKQGRVYKKNIKYFFSKKHDNEVIKNINNKYISTSLIYILSKKN